MSSSASGLRSSKSALVKVRPSRDESRAVARVYDISGHVYVRRAGKGTLVELQNGDSIDVGDHIISDSDSVAALEFVLGGVVGIKKGTTEIVIGERETRNPNDSLLTKAHSVWAYFNKEETPLTIQNHGGAFGIKG